LLRRAGQFAGRDAKSGANASLDFLLRLTHRFRRDTREIGPEFNDRSLTRIDFIGGRSAQYSEQGIGPRFQTYS
jgi:hypothetical protein